MEEPWWSSFFDEDYVRLWGVWLTPDGAREQADGLWALAGLQPEACVLDAPCGYGRLSRALAERGAIVLGVDQSETQLAIAGRGRDGIGEDRLRYLRHDLRVPLGEGGFDAALCVYSSLGYGSEEDDLAILRTLAGALRPGGRLIVETNQRDAIAASLARGGPPGQRLPDGTLLVEKPRLDAVTGRIETVWYWSGPSGSGEKRASLRVYNTNELVGLVERAGLELVSLHAGCSIEPFRPEGPMVGGRVALLARRPG